MTAALRLRGLKRETTPPPAPGPVSFISSTGSDTTGTGSYAAPWKTLQKFIDSNPDPGATLYVRGGTYSSVAESVSGHGQAVLTGTVAAPIVIRNYPGEVPLFSGGSGPLLGLAECAYVTVEGLSMIGRDIGDSGYIYTGAWDTTGYLAHHITIRGNTFNFSLTGQLTTEHGVYISKSTEYVTVEDNIFLGPGIGNGGGYGLHAYASATNGPRNLTIQRNVFKGWDQAGVLFWNSSITGTIAHNTFLLNSVDVRLEVFTSATVSDCAFDSPSGSTAIMGTPTSATANFYSQSFGADYYLVPGQTGINAATGGTDAGARDGAPAATGSFYMAPGGSDLAAGTYAAPWASIQKFIDTNPAAGTTLYLRGGTYSPATDGGITGRDSYGNLIGTVGSPITIRNFPGEVPSFPGATGGEPCLCFEPNATAMAVNYVIVDGLQFPGATIDDTATIRVGGVGAGDATRLVKNLTFKNMVMSLGAGTTSVDHCIGLLRSAENITIEDSVFIGPRTAGQGGSGVTIYSQPAALNTIIRRCVFDGFNNDSAASILIWDYAATPILTLTIDHCSFLNNDDEIDIRYHSTTLITNCAFDGADGPVSVNTSPIFDPNNNASTTLSYNFYSQSFGADYYLVAGQTGRDGASDGNDAGALDW